MSWFCLTKYTKAVSDKRIAGIDNNLAKFPLVDFLILDLRCEVISDIDY